jgi:hypothetical protein
MTFAGRLATSRGGDGRDQGQRLRCVGKGIAARRGADQQGVKRAS